MMAITGAVLLMFVKGLLGLLNPGKQVTTAIPHERLSCEPIDSQVTVTFIEHVAVFPQSSVAVQVTVVVPAG
ncbi:hypothetical protein D3C83_97380 [compost metagenome]